jgi:sporulation protein YlmC with PRC-barrel domain
VTRGLAILTSEGQEAGKVAGVIVDDDSQKVTRILPNNQRPHFYLICNTCAARNVPTVQVCRIRNFILQWWFLANTPPTDEFKSQVPEP